MTDYPHTVDHNQLTRLVRKLCGRQAAVVTDWNTTPVKSGLSGALVHRIKGCADDRGTAFPWSFVVKQVDRTAPGADWPREILVYRNGLVSHLPGGLRAPRCMDIVDLSASRTALWLEDVGPNWGQHWPLERFGLAAYHLGQFGGHYAEPEKRPDFSWLCRDKWQQNLHHPKAIESLKQHRHLPQVQAVYPPDIADRILAVWDQRLTFVERVHRLAPFTFTHGDATGRNLYDLEGQTVAIDWEDAGVGPLGEDIARTLGSNIHWFFQGRMELAAELAEIIFGRYLEGLRDVGWKGDPHLVRYVYCAVAGSIYSIAYTTAVPRIVGSDPEKWARSQYGISATEALEHRSLMARFFLGMADEARALAKELD
ncbi:MAG: phosphotransferase [Candidatus Latescibacteria bacterium]|nr:phosphotransferase [Candidatus Latescibacterota bacterium]